MIDRSIPLEALIISKILALSIPLEAIIISKILALSIPLDAGIRMYVCTFIIGLISQKEKKGPPRAGSRGAMMLECIRATLFHEHLQEQILCFGFEKEFGCLTN